MEFANKKMIYYLIVVLKTELSFIIAMGHISLTLSWALSKTKPVSFHIKD